MRLLLVLSAALLVPAAAHAQSGGFLVLLGRDTVQIESFSRNGSAITGSVVYRSPVTRLVKYRLELGADGAPLRYEQSVFDGTGKPIEPNAANATMVFSRDSVVRETVRGAEPVTQRLAAPAGALPVLGGSNMIPFAYSYLTYELALPGARARAQNGESRMPLFSTLPNSTAPQNSRIWLVGSDSVEMDYFGVARAGFKFDAQGRLQRSSWHQTTYKYDVSRIAAVDVESLARKWAPLDAAGQGIGRYSPRDTARGSVGGASVVVDYSRPSARGRTIWGGVVPWDQVWRLGADMATQLTTDVPLVIGGTAVPAGKYSLWMLPSQTAPMLVINSQSGQFGTQYDAKRDFARVPLTRAASSHVIEKLTIGVGDTLTIGWGDAAYSVALMRG